MLDFVLGVLLVALALRGWLRGFVREAIGLGVVVAGSFLAFRLSTPLGEVVESMAGTSADVSRLIAGLFLVVVIAVGAWIVAHVVHAGLRIVPGLTTLNRLGGAAFSALAGVFVITVAVSLLATSAFGAGWRDAVTSSTIGGWLADPDAAPQRVVSLVAGDQVIAAVLALQDVAGARRIVGPDTGRIRVTPTDRGDVRVAGGAADRAYDLLNRERAAANATPLTRSDRLDAVALAYAREVAVTGRISDRGRGGATLQDRLAAESIVVQGSDQVVVVAPSPRSAHEALTLDEASYEEMVGRNYLRVGVAALKLPLGILVVEVFTT
jgi:membrane protein required for colicin V production